MNLKRYLIKKKHLLKLHFSKFFNSKTENVNINKILIGSQAGFPLEYWVSISGEYNRLSTHISESPYVKFLKEIIKDKSKLNNKDYLKETAYFKMGIKCIQTVGSYMGTTTEDELIQWMKAYYQQYENYTKKLNYINFPFKKGHSKKNEPIYLAKIKGVDLYEILDGHHRVAINYVLSKNEIEACIAYEKFSGLQKTLLKVNQIHDIELYQPVDRIEVKDWPIVRKCEDRFEKMKAYIESENIFSGSMIDLACSYGWFPKKFKELGFNVLGIDRDPGAIVIAEHITGLKQEEVQCIRIEDFFKQNKNQYDIVLFLSILHHYALGKEPGNVSYILKELDKITNKILFIDTGQNHEAWFKKNLKEWDNDYIENLILSNTSFKKVINLGTDNDNVGKYSNNYKRTLFACIK